MAVTTAITVPTALLATSSNESSDTSYSSQATEELQYFKNKFPGSIEQSGSSVAITANAFEDKQLDSDFTIPVLVKSIRAYAFKGVQLPAGFTIPYGTTEIDPTAFSEVVWERSSYCGQSFTQSYNING